MSEKLNEIFTQVDANNNLLGIFDAMNSCYSGMGITATEIAWLTGTISSISSETTPHFLDENFIDLYGERYVSPEVGLKRLRIIENNPTWTEAQIDAALRPYLAKMVLWKYKDKWISMWNALKTEYDVAYNYDMYDSITTTATLTTGSTLTSTVKAKNKQTSSNSSSVYGFNSSTPAGAATSSGTTEGTQADNEQQKTDNNTGTNTNRGNTTEHKYGNIGVTSSQELIKKELELRSLVFIEDIVFPDIKEELTLKIY